MDFIYMVDFNSYLNDEELKPTDTFACSLSNKNIFALSNDCYVYLLPLEKPNELVPVTLSNSSCIYICWSDDGQYLLNVFKNGSCQIYNVKTNLLNSIDLAFEFQLIKSDVACIKSFSKSPKLCFNSEKKDSPNYLEKYYYKSFNCLKNFGKFSYNGFIILTKSGIIHICISDYNSIKNKFEKFEYDMKLTLRPSTDNEMMEDNAEQENISFDLADFSFETDGSINVIFTNFDIATPVYLYKVNLKLLNDGSLIEGTNELIASINVHSESMTSKTRLLFQSNESAQSFCVCLRSNQTNTDVIQVWQPSQLNQNLIGTFDLNMSTDQSYLLKTINCPSPLIQLTVPKCAIAFKDLNDNKTQNEPLYLTAAYQNGTFGFIDTQNYNQTFTSAIPIKSDSFSNTEPSIDYNKKLKYTQEYVVMMDQSQTGAVSAGLTNFCRLITIRQSPLVNNTTQANLNHLFNLYEYCMLTGYDNWDLTASTNPNIVDALIERVEDKYQNQIQQSFQKVYFSQHYSLLCSLYRRSPSSFKFKPLETLTRLVLNRSMSIVTFSVQFVFNVENLASSIATSLPASTGLINKSSTPATINTALINSNLDLVNQPVTTSQQPTHFMHSVKFENNLNEYFSEVLLSSNVKPNVNDLKINLNELVQLVLSRKNYQITVNQQLKHVFQWIIDLSLYLISMITVVKQTMSTASSKSTSFYGSGLLNDLAFLNEIRKALAYIKLILVYTQTQPQPNTLIMICLPVFPLRSSSQKDLISEIFNIYTKFMVKLVEGASFFSDDSLIEQCTTLQSETVSQSMKELFFNSKQSWLGNSVDSWNKVLQFPVDHLFDEEKERQQYPLFDIIRLIKFSRSALTKQCVKCGNFTESNTQTSIQNSKTNGLTMQDYCGDRCICGGAWVLSPIQ